MTVVSGVFSRFTLVKSQPSTRPTNGKTVAKERVKHRVSGLEKRIEKARTVAKVVLKEIADPSKRLSWQTCYPMRKRDLENLCCPHPQ